MKLYKKGQFLIKEGETGKECFVLYSGRLGVFKNGTAISEISQRGTIFGELSEILNVPRSSTIQALEDSLVMVFEKGHEELIRKHPEVAKKILIYMAERLAKTTDKLTGIKEVINKI